MSANPNPTKQAKTVMLKCPTCKRSKRVQRQPYDSPTAKTLLLKCDRCDDGGGFSESEPVEPKPAKQDSVKARVVRTPRLPRGKTGYTNRDQLQFIRDEVGNIYGKPGGSDPSEFSVAVIPAPTQQAAKAIVKWANLSREQKFAMLVARLKKRENDERAEDGYAPIVDWDKGTFEDEANFILALMEGKP